MKPKENIENFIDALKCVNCGADNLAYNEEHLKCENCGFKYQIANGIPDMKHPSKGARMPKIYSDPDYLKWLDNLTDGINYFYNTKGVVSYVQNYGHRIVRKLKGGKEYERTLDLGCGNGDHYPYLRSPDKCFGIDIDMKALNTAKTRHPDYFVMRADCYDMPVRDSSVDCIVSVYSLEHMVYLDLVLEEMDRILKSEGDIFISVPNEGGWLWGFGRSLTSAKKFSRESYNYNRVVAIEHINCIWQIEKALKRYFCIQRKASFPFLIGGFYANLISAYHCRKK